MGLASLTAARLFSYASGGRVSGWESRGVASAAIWGGLLFAAWPVHAFCSSVWSADSAANAALLASLALSLPRVGSRAGLRGWQVAASALAGAAAIACRQTSAVWLVPVATGAVLRRLHDARRPGVLAVSAPGSIAARRPEQDRGGVSRPAPNGSPSLSGRLRQRAVALSLASERRGGRGAPVSSGVVDTDVAAQCSAGPPSSAAGQDVTGLPSAVLAALRGLPTVWREVAAYGSALASVAAHAAGRGGLALGERSNHTPTMHAAHAGYALTAAAAALALPLCARSPLQSARLAWEWLSGRCLGCTARQVGQRLEELGARVGAEGHSHAESEAAPMRGARVCSWGSQALLLIALCGAASLAAGGGTVSQPFLLENSGRIGALVWKRLLGDKQWLWFALGPLYVAAAGATAALVLSSRAGGTVARSAALADAIVLASILAMGFTPLVEPRFWTPLVALLAPVAAATWGSRPARGVGALVVAVLLGVSSGVAFVFVARPYTLADGSTARLVW